MPIFLIKTITHALCAAHLLRELIVLVEDSSGFQWATNLKELLQEAIELVQKRKIRRKLTKKEYKQLSRGDSRESIFLSQEPD